MTSFTVENPTSLSNTCKFWKLVSKNEELEDHYIGYTQGAACRWEESDGKFSHWYSNIDIEEFVKNNGGWEKWDPQFIEECDWQGWDHAKTKQQELAEASPHATTNHVKRCRTKEEEQQWKDRRKQKNKEYREEHKEYFNNIRAAPADCPYCKCAVQKQSLARHNKSQKHKLAQQHAETNNH